MAMVVTVTDFSVQGNKRRNTGKVALDNSYPAGGYPVSAQAFGLSVIEFLDVIVAQGYTADYDSVSKTLRIYDISFVLVGGQLAGNVVQIDATNVLGKTAPGNVNVTAKPSEVATGTDLSAITAGQFNVQGV